MLDPAWPPRAREAACCLATMDNLGRICIGFCGPACIRRRPNWARYCAEQRAAQTAR